MKINKLTKEQKDMLNAMTSLRRGVALNSLLGMTPAEAHKQAGGTCNNEDHRYKLASEILLNPDVKAFMDSVNSDIGDETKVDASYVRKRLYDMDNLDIMEILAEDCSVRPLSEWPKKWRISISALSIVQLAEGVGDPSKTASIMKTIKWPDKMKGLELIGKLSSVNAFKDTVELDVKGVVFNMNFGDKDNDK